MGNVFINIQGQDELEDTGAIMLQINDYENVKLGDLKEMLNELIDMNISFSDTPKACIDKGSYRELEPLLEMFELFILRVTDLHDKCTDEIQAEVYEANRTIYEL
jgi:hypothetical protein